MYGLKGNLPDIDLPDEILIVVNSLRMGRTHLRPSTFVYPALCPYIALFEYGIFFIFGKLIGIFSSSTEFGYYFLDNPTPFYMIVRFTTAIFGILTVGLVYKINQEQVSKRAGLLSSALLAVSELHVFRSHFAGVDVPMVFFLTLSLYFMFRTISKQDYRYLILSGVCVGLSIAAKYNAGLIVLPYFALPFILLTKSKGKNVVIKNWILGFIAIPCAFFIVCPYALLDVKKFLADIYMPLFREPIYGYVGMEYISSGWWYYFSDTLPNGLGLPIFVICLIGVAYSLYKHKHYDIMMLVFLFPYYFFVGASHTVYHRFLLPIFPFLVLLAGRFLDEVLMITNKKINKLIYAFLGVIILLSAKDSFINSYTLSKRDIRLEVREWIMKNVPSKSYLLTDTHGPPLPLNREALAERLKNVNLKGGAGFATKYMLDKPEQQICYYVHILSPHSLDAYKGIDFEKFDYYIIVNIDEDRFTRLPDKYKEEVATYDYIRKNMRLVKSFRTKKYQPGPEKIEIFKR